MNQARKYALAYLGQKVGLEDLLDWVADATSPVVDLGLDEADKELAAELELRAAELTGGHISEGRFRSHIQEIVGDTKIVFLSTARASRVWEVAPSRATTVRLEHLAVCG